MDTQTRFKDIPLTVSLNTDPELAGLDLMAEGEREVAGYACSTRIVPLDRESQLISWRIRRLDGGKFRVVDFKVNASVPGLDLHRMFVPVLHEGIGKLDRISLPWSIRERTFTSWSFPLIAALNRADENRFCMGFMDHVRTAEMTQNCYDEDARMGLRRVYDEEPLETTLWEETLYLSCSGRHLFDELRAFARAYDQVQQPVLCQTPPAAWEPVWCSWYGIKNEVNAGYILGMAPLLKAWGFGSVIIDAGWFVRDGFDEDTGHYVPDEGKFPDLRGMIEAVQAQGLGVLLWCAPLFRLEGVAEQPFIRRNLLEPDGAPQKPFTLCPRVGAVRDYVRRMVGHLMQAYGADGLKIDMIDALKGPENHRCTADHEHDIESYGAAMHVLFKEIHDAVKAVRPDALIEFRMNYSNPVTRSFATSHRAQDAPYDFDHIRRMCTRLKSYMINPELGEEGNVAVHTDPAYWLPQESAENVARFMSSLVTSGVPMLSMDLRSLPEEHGLIVRAWLGFFGQHRDLLLFGAHRALSADPHYSIFSVHREKQVLWGIFTGYVPGELPVPGKGIRQLWLLNGSAQSRLFTRLPGVEGEGCRARIYDRGLGLTRTEELAIRGGILLLDVEIEVGGAIEITVEV
ncbi:MAG: hypothetical protein ABIG68_04995 [Acidobacteriota bacterium]